MIEDRKVKPGTQLVARHRGKEYRANVVVGEGGKPRYRLGVGQEFSSPSAAGSAVMGGIACNGRRFWSVAVVEDAKPATTSKKAAPARTSGKTTRKVQKKGK